MCYLNLIIPLLYSFMYSFLFKNGNCLSFQVTQCFGFFCLAGEFRAEGGDKITCFKDGNSVFQPEENMKAMPVNALNKKAIKKPVYLPTQAKQTRPWQDLQ